MKLHEIEKIIVDATGIKPWAENGGLEIFIDADNAKKIEPVCNALENLGIKFIQKPSRKTFKGALFFIPLRNIGTAFYANWEFE